MASREPDRESLTARFKRVLGRAPSESSPENPSPEAEDSYSKARKSNKRREQVLNAQRTHRHRTQQYIRELEKEVFRLRDENEALRRVAEQVGGEHSSAQDSHARSDATALQFGGNDDLTEANSSNLAKSLADFPVSVDLTGLANAVPEGACTEHPAEFVPPVYHSAGPTFLQSASDQQQRQQPFRAPNQTIASQPNGHDSHQQELYAQIGIDFILSLEGPCFAHIKHAHLGYNAGIIPEDIIYNFGPGHALMASAVLTHRYGDRGKELEKSTLALPSREIERLVQASARLQLDWEVTPVQIWVRIRDGMLDGKIAPITARDSQTLAEVVGKYAYCNSFGAVVQKITADSILRDYLGLD